MELQQQVTNLELSKRMKELGFIQESYFMWVDGEVWDRCSQSDYEMPSTPSRDKWIPAYTVSELGELLPKIIVSVNGIRYGLEIYWSDTKTSPIIGYWNNDGNPTRLHTEIADDLVNAMAKMLCYLKENNLL